MPVVIFPDATDLVIDYLAGALAARGETAPVRPRVPNPRPAKFVVIRRVGGIRRDLVTDAPRIAYECSAQTEEAASDLAGLVRSLLIDMRGKVQSGHAIYRVTESGGPADLPDPLSDQPRYVGELEIGIRGTAG